MKIAMINFNEQEPNAILGNFYIETNDASFAKELEEQECFRTQASFLDAHKSLYNDISSDANFDVIINHELETENILN